MSIDVDAIRQEVAAEVEADRATARRALEAGAVELLRLVPQSQLGSLNPIDVVSAICAEMHRVEWQEKGPRLQARILESNRGVGT